MALNAKYTNGMVLAVLGLLWSFFQPVLAAPGNGGPVPTGTASRFYTYTFSPIKDYQLVPNGVDVLEVSVSPIPPPNTQLSISFGGATSLVATTDANGNAYFY